MIPDPSKKSSEIRGAAFRAAPGSPPQERSADKNADLPAVISVYLALVLLLVVGLIFTVTESARVSASRARINSISYMAADSVFSSFAEPIFEDYGVMFLWMSEADIENSFSTYAEMNMEYSDLSSLIFTDLYKISLEEVSTGTVTRPADNGGEVFAEQVLDYMDYFLAEDALESVLDGLSVFEQTDAVSGFMDKISEQQETFTRVEEAVSEINDITEEAKNADDPSDYLNEMLEALEEYAETGSSSSASDFSSALSSLKTSASTLSEYMTGIDESSDEYYECAEAAMEATDQLESDLEEEIEDLSGDVYEALKEQIEELRQKSADTDYDYFGVSANNEIADEYSQILSSLDTLYSSLDENLNNENAENYTAIVSEYTEIFEDLDLDALGVNLESDTTEKEDGSFLSAISDLFTDGFLSLVADDISENKISTDSLPSVTAEDQDTDTDDDTSLLETAGDKAIFCEYVLQHFGNYVDTDPSAALSYETEYIIAGKASDKENLSAVATDIALIRASLNFISLLKDSEKKSEAYTLAAAIVGFAGLPVLITVCQLFILSIWAMAEGISDVKTLLSGGKVETIKSSDDWNISISSLKNFTKSDIQASSSDSGLGYGSYLRILLLMKNDSILYLRTLDMIQANMCANENEDFLISDCVTAVTLDAKYEVPYLFLSFGFARSLSNAEGSAYEISVSVNYGY